MGAQLATAGSLGWIGGREAALSTREKRPGTSDPTERPRPLFQWLPPSPSTLRSDHPRRALDEAKERQRDTEAQLEQLASYTEHERTRRHERRRDTQATFTGRLSSVFAAADGPLTPTPPAVVAQLRAARKEGEEGKEGRHHHRHRERGVGRHRDGSLYLPQARGYDSI